MLNYVYIDIDIELYFGIYKSISILLRKIEGKILDEKFIAPTKNYININNNYITAYNEAKKTRESGSVAVLKGDK